MNETNLAIARKVILCAGLRSNRIIKALLILSAMCLSAAAQPQTITGKVVGVSDGDTITVLDDQKRQRDRGAKKAAAKKSKKGK
jgi:endonuclease YncB( thermonuclease family)